MEASTSGEVRKLKVVLLGEGAVGKTSIVLRYVDDKFNTKHYQTLQASFAVKKVNVSGKRVEINVWDTAGQERFHALGPIYYRDSQGAVLVFDVTDPDSFVKVQNWVKELRRILGDSVQLVIAGNKSDLKERNVTDDEAQRYAESVGATYHATSAKENIGIVEMFLALTKRMLAAAEAAELAAPVVASRRRNILISDDPEPTASRKCC